MLVLVAWTSAALAWPTDADWSPVVRDGRPLTDACGDGERDADVVGTADAPAAWTHFDGETWYVRIRLARASDAPRLRVAGETRLVDAICCSCRSW